MIQIKSKSSSKCKLLVLFSFDHCLQTCNWKAHVGAWSTNTNTCVKGCAGLWQEMGVARPVCQLISQARRQKKRFVSSKLGMLNIPQSPTHYAHNICFHSLCLFQSTISQVTSTAAPHRTEEWMTRSDLQHQEKSPGAMKCTDCKGPFDCQ